MADVHNKKTRSYNMSRIRGSETKAELKLRPFLNALGFTYQPKNISEKPDFAHRKEKVAVFIDGCFWHKCPKHYIPPKQNADFWKKKIERNVLRDEKVNRSLRKKGWKVIRIWECKLK